MCLEGRWTCQHVRKAKALAYKVSGNTFHELLEPQWSNTCRYRCNEAKDAGPFCHNVRFACRFRQDGLLCRVQEPLEPQWSNTCRYRCNESKDAGPFCRSRVASVKMPSVSDVCAIADFKRPLPRDLRTIAKELRDGW